MIRSRSFQRNLFLSIGGSFLLFALCFSIYQYRREKEYKIDLMHARLQMYNYEMLQTLGDSIASPNAFNHYVKTHNVEGLRVTLVSDNGNVIIDSQKSQASQMGNHLQRPEIQQALAEGNGYDSRRTSKSTHETYFYSATLVEPHSGVAANASLRAIQGAFIIRSAVPYSAELTESLRADNTYLYFAALITVLLGITLYVNTRRIGRHIGYLREFAVKAEQGEELDHELERRLPDDELGDISHTIITLYWKLRHAEEDKVRIKRQLTQNAAHELKTPTASIHGYLESILENPNMPADQRQHFLERCYAQSERMSKLLLDMAALTKLDELVPENAPGVFENNSSSLNSVASPLKGLNGLNTTMVNVLDVINSVLDDTALQLEGKGIIPRLNVPEKVEIVGDRSFIYSIFRNLVDNAIAYAIGANRLSITCVEVDDGTHSYDENNYTKKESDNNNSEHYSNNTSNCERRYYEFVVADNGVGVDPQHLSHLFERFYRVDKGRSRKLGGTGLGLAIVKNAVAAHGGTCSADLTPGGGLTVKFTLAKP